MKTRIKEKKMPSKREQILWKGVWPAAERCEQTFGLTASLSAGIILFDVFSGDIQKTLISMIKPQTGQNEKFEKITLEDLAEILTNKDLGLTMSPQENAAFKAIIKCGSSNQKKVT